MNVSNIENREYETRIVAAFEADKLTTCLELLEDQAININSRPYWEYLKGDIMRRIGLKDEAGETLMSNLRRPEIISP